MAECKKFLCTLLMIVLSFLSAHAADQVTVTAPPSIWARQQGDQLTGPVVDLVRQIFSEVHVRVDTKILPWARAIDQIKTGELDIMLVIFRTDDRARFMDFTIPYVKVPTAIFVPKGKSFAFNHLDDLIGRQGVMMKGDSISPEFERFKPRLTIMEVSGYDQAAKMLVGLRADYAAGSKYGFLVPAKRLGLESKITLLPTPIASRNLHMAFSKTSGAARYFPMVNHRLKQLKADGSMAKMVEKALKQAVHYN